MNTPIGKTKTKRPSKGMRKHNRRIKQEVRKGNMSESELKKRLRQQ